MSGGIFITAEFEGALKDRLQALQEQFDPKMARYLPPHVTIVGSSGAGPILADTPRDLLKERVEGVARVTAPLTLRFGAPIRFLGREIVVLPLDPHGPLRALHEALKGMGVPFAPARYPFTPHCTLNLYPTLTPDRLRTMMAVRVSEPFELHTLRVYHTQEPQPPTHLFDARLDGVPSSAPRGSGALRTP